MEIDLINIIVAISTAATAGIALFATKTSFAPELTSTQVQREGLPPYLCIQVHPGSAPIHIHKISARNALIDDGHWDVTPDGRSFFEESGHGLTRRSISVSLDFPSSRVPGDIEPLYLLIKFSNSRCAARISLHARFMCLPIKYSVNVKPNIDTAYTKFKI